MKHLGQLIKETVAVIIGVLFALYINNWNEDNKDKEYLNKIYSSIEKEMQEGQTEIKKVIPQQLAFADSIGKYMDNDEVSLYDIMIKADGIYVPTIKTNSWNAIVNSKIELIEYEKLSELADFEERKVNLTGRIEKQVDFLFQNFEETDKQKKKVLKMMILDVVGTEKRLYSTIGEILKNKIVITDD